MNRREAYLYTLYTWDENDHHGYVYHLLTGMILQVGLQVCFH